MDMLHTHVMQVQRIPYVYVHQVDGRAIHSVLLRGQAVIVALHVFVVQLADLTLLFVDQAVQTIKQVADLTLTTMLQNQHTLAVDCVCQKTTVVVFLVIK
jgi:hypothetical protein